MMRKFFAAELILLFALLLSCTSLQARSLSPLSPLSSPALKEDPSVTSSTGTEGTTSTFHRSDGSSESTSVKTKDSGMDVETKVNVGKDGTVKTEKYDQETGNSKTVTQKPNGERFGDTGNGKTTVSKGSDGKKVVTTKYPNGDEVQKTEGTTSCRLSNGVSTEQRVEDDGSTTTRIKQDGKRTEVKNDSSGKETGRTSTRVNRDGSRTTHKRDPNGKTTKVTKRRKVTEKKEGNTSTKTEVREKVKEHPDGSKTETTSIRTTKVTKDPKTGETKTEDTATTTTKTSDPDGSSDELTVKISTKSVKQPKKDKPPADEWEEDWEGFDEPKEEVTGTKTITKKSSSGKTETKEQKLDHNPLRDNFDGFYDDFDLFDEDDFLGDKSPWGKNFGKLALLEKLSLESNDFQPFDNMITIGGNSSVEKGSSRDFTSLPQAHSMDDY